MKTALRFLAGLLCLLCLSGCGLSSLMNPPPKEEGGKVLNIFCWNQEFKSRLERFYPGYNRATHMIGDVKVNWVIVPNTSSIYQMMLDEALADQDNVPADDKVDIFLVEADFAKQYVQVPGKAISLQALGLTEQELSEQFPYTRMVAMDADGIQRGISWQACPGAMVYRRDIARKVFGTDDPRAVQQAVSSWGQFDAAAARMAAAGFRMVAGFEDTFRVFMNNMQGPWVNERGEIVMDPAVKSWVEQTRRYTELRYNHRCKLWDKEWSRSVRGDVFCYFGPAWLIDYSLAPFSLEQEEKDGGLRERGNGTFGEWAVCRGPQSYFWGGTWICAAEGTDNPELVADIMRVMCCDPMNAKAMAHGVNEFVNNRSAMRELAENEHFGVPFLGGQNYYRTLYDSAEQISMQNTTPYDWAIVEALQSTYRRYYRGEISEAEAHTQFIESVREVYPELHAVPAAE